MKILYCIAGMGLYGVLESDLHFREGLVISAKRVFSVERDLAQSVLAPKGDFVSLAIVPYDDVMMNCTFISNMPEKSPFYQKIMEIIEREVNK